MPEGDTLWRTARTLEPHLIGRRVVQASVSQRWPAVATDTLSSLTISALESRGKHLLIHFDGGLCLHSHLGMTGSWHLYREAEDWHKPAHRAALSLHTDRRAVAVCFSPQQLELLTSTGLRRHPWLQRLGPDILAVDLPLDEITQRLAAWPLLPLGEALLHQAIVAGLGNVYKSEVLFLERLDPFATVSSLQSEQHTAWILRARQLMRQNLTGGPRRTRMGRDGPRVWVYGRSGQSCLVCGERIRMRRQGDLARSTYYCPRCQSVREVTTRNCETSASDCPGTYGPSGGAPHAR